MALKWINCLVFVTAVLTGLFLMCEAKEINPIESSCSQCHENLKEILPDNHTTIKGQDITSCLSCHTPNLTEDKSPNPFSAHIHRTHLQPHDETDCMICHTYDPGNSFGLQGLNVSYGSPTGKTMDRIRTVFASWVNSSFLDSIHSKNDIICFGCHGINLFNEEKPSISETCVSCHPGYIMTPEELSSISLTEINPHKSHQGNLDCTICHKSHKASILYCQKCHGDFKLEIPGGTVLPVS